MFNKYLLTLYFFIFAFAQSASAQHDIKVVNNDNIQLPYVHIVSFDNDVYFISDENGVFTLNNDNIDQSTLFIFSHIGYKNDTLSLKEILTTEKITLVENTINLKEIVVSEKKLKQRVLTRGFDPLVCYSLLQCPNGIEVALRILPMENHSYLKSVSFYIDNSGIPNSPFGLRLYYVDSITNKPSELMQTKDIVINGYKGDEWVKYEFLNKIEIPKEGFYIAMEWLPNSKRFLEEKAKGHNGIIIANGQVLKANKKSSQKWKDRVYTRWFPIKEWSKLDCVPAIKCEIMQYK